jgi:hypothetical protein
MILNRNAGFSQGSVEKSSAEWSPPPFLPFGTRDCAAGRRDCDGGHSGDLLEISLSDALKGHFCGKSMWRARGHPA